MNSESSEWFSALRNAGPKPYWKAASEISVICFISILPLFFAALGVFVDQPSDIAEKRTFTEIFLSASMNGQLFFYAISIVASVIWYSGTEFKKPFPVRLYFFIPCIIGLVVSSIYISRDPTLKSLADADIGAVSLTTYIMSAILYFIILVFRHIDSPNLESSSRESEDDLYERMLARLAAEAEASNPEGTK